MKEVGDLERSFCRDEYFDYLIYSELARREGDPILKSLLERFSEQEERHYRFWRERSGECAGEVGLGRLRLFTLMRRLLGLAFTIRLLERHEKSVIEAYKEYLAGLSGREREELERIIRDEEEHEEELLARMDEESLRYLGFVVLGLADAIVEITGVHAGFLGVTAATLIAGIAGLIVGLSASISMAGAAYLQAKSGGVSRPGLSAIVTGASYFVAVVLLALPYFVTHAQITAFIASVAIAVAMVTGFTFYGSVIKGSSFAREYTENLVILFGTAAAAYAFGVFLGEIFGIRGVLVAG